jgi:flotillin
MVDIVQVVIAIVVIVVGVVGGLALYARCYIRIPPNKAMVVFGLRRMDGSKYQILLHGGKFITPIYEDYGFLPLEVFTLHLELKDMWTKDRVRVEAKAVVHYALRQDEEGLEAAAQNFFKKDDAVIKTAVEAKVTEAGLEVMREHDGEYISAERTRVSEEWKARANKELKQLGLVLKTVVLQNDIKLRVREASDQGDIHSMKSHLTDLRSELATLEARLSTLDKPKGRP